jgi:hypothetical protein
MSTVSVVRLAGFAQLALAVASLAIPFALRWREETALLRPLLRRLFWVYAGYLLGLHVAFGTLSALAPQWLLDGSPLARAVTGFLTLYWGVRLALQFVCFQTSDAPRGLRFRAAEAALVSLFVFLTAGYGAAFLEQVWR